MIISKQNLEAVNITKVDKNVPALDNVHIAEDGSTIGIGGRMFVVISPVSIKLKQKISGILDEHGDGGFTVSADTVRGILKDIPSDRKFQGLLEHCNIEQEDGLCKIAIPTDGKRKKEVTGRLYPKDYLPYKKIVHDAVKECMNETGHKIVLNLKRLILLLTTIEKIAPDSGADLPVWIEFTKDNYIVIRGINVKTGQRVIGVMQPFTGTEGKWLEPDDWEMSFIEDEKSQKKVMTKNKVMTKKKIMTKNKIVLHKRTF